MMYVLFIFAAWLIASLAYGQTIPNNRDYFSSTNPDGSKLRLIGPSDLGTGGVKIDPDNHGVEMEGSISPQSFGAKADGTILGGISGTAGCSGTAGTASLTCSASSFTSADVGKSFDLSHAGASSCGLRYYGVRGSTFNCNLVGTIRAVNSATSITLSTNLSNSVSNEQFAYGTPDQAAILAAINSGAPVIHFVGTYVIGASIGTVALQNRILRGDGIQKSRFLIIGPVAYGPQKWASLTLDNGTHDVTFDGIGWLGTNELGQLNAFGGTPDALMMCTGIPGGLNGACGSGSGILNVIVRNCAFDYTWGIGFHAPGTGTRDGQQVIGLYVYNSFARFNSYDGFNPNPYDQLVMSGDVATDNGTGGIEASVQGKMTITGGQFLRNKNVGIAVGGFDDHTSCPTGVEIIGNDISENGDGSTVNTAGAGIWAGSGACNVAIVGNTIRKNHLIGINYDVDTQDSGLTITGNIITSNGIANASNPSIGAYLKVKNATISGNLIRDEGVSGFTQSYGLYIRSGTTNATIANNAVYGNAARNIEIDGTTAVAFSGANLPNNASDLYVGITPSLSGVTIRTPDVQTVTTACMTAVSAGATCTLIVTHSFGQTPNQFSCFLSDTPTTQTGKPIIVKYADLNANQTQVTIGTLDGNAAGGGTLRCRVNYAY
jgi:hypothetical protein